MTKTGTLIIALIVAIFFNTTGIFMLKMMNPYDPVPELLLQSFLSSAPFVLSAGVIAYAIKKT